jgi:hypothetical protein
VRPRARARAGEGSVNGGEVENLDAGDWGRARGAEIALLDGTALATPARLTPQRHNVQFTAREEHVLLAEKARALLSHSAPREGSTRSTCAQCAPSWSNSSGRSTP